MRTTNNLGGDGSEKSSVKVTNAPGGKSNFSLGWGDEQPTQTKSSIRKYNNQSSIFGGPEEPKVKTPLEENKRDEAFGKMGQGRTTSNIGEDQKTSVKVHYAPGGQSSISFGDDKSEPYRKKENIKPATRYDPISEPMNTNTNPIKTSVKVHAPPGGKSNFSFA